MAKHLLSTTNMIRLLSILALVALFGAGAGAQSTMGREEWGSPGVGYSPSIDRPLGEGAMDRVLAAPGDVDLSPSTKSVDKTFALDGEQLRYTIVLSNAGIADATGVLVTDTLPLNTIFVPGSGSASKGTFLGTTGLMWAGDISVGESVTLTFDVTIDAGTLGWPITNLAQIDDGMGTVISRSATTIANPRRTFLPIIAKRGG